jgi:hypothetical protein
MVLLVFITGILSCKKSTTLGLIVLPPGDDINAVFSDTFSVVANPMKEDSIKTSAAFYSIIGNMFDPVFGKTYAALFTEFGLPTSSVNVGNPDTLFIDSVVLTMTYAGTYGYKDVPQSYNVYQLTERMSPLPENGYYSNKAFSVDPEPLGRKRLVVPNLTDSIKIGAQTFLPHLRIRLSDRFGQDLLNQSGGTNFLNDTSFKKFLYGLCVAPDTANTPYSASEIYFNMYSGSSGLRLYWHTPNTSGNTFTFPVTTNEVKTSYFKHNFTGSVVQSHLTENSTTGDSLLFLQALSGVSTRITIPGLPNLHDVIINKAELQITQRPDPNGADTVFTPPVQILVVTKDSTGKYVVLPDENDNSHPFPAYGGNKKLVEIAPGDTVAQYKVNISQQVQLLIDGKITDYGLFLIPFSGQETADRLMAGGNDRQDAWKLKLNLIYSEIK